MISRSEETFKHLLNEFNKKPKGQKSEIIAPEALRQPQYDHELEFEQALSQLLANATQIFHVDLMGNKENKGQKNNFTDIELTIGSQIRHHLTFATLRSQNQRRMKSTSSSNNE
uniref:Uncharacterized protein n=1 Tax=Romanomermis culicivorax TaxID=13658 RepID=A0A915J6F6_ROMCU